MAKKSIKKLIKRAARSGKRPRLPSSKKSPKSKVKGNIKRAFNRYTSYRRVSKPIRIEKLHEHLKDAGVPLRLSESMHEIVHSDSGVKKEVGGALKEAIKKKHHGMISEEGLTKVIREAVKHTKKEGLDKEELRDIIKEVLESELKKGEFLAAHQVQQGEIPPGPVSKVEAVQDLSMPLPSVTDVSMAKRGAGIGIEWGTKEQIKVNITYPIQYKKGKVKVYANIRYDPSLRGLLYRIIEPKISEEDKEILDKIESTLVEELEVDFAALKRQTAERYLEEKIEEVIAYYDLKITERSRDITDYYIKRDFIGLGRVEPMADDPNIEDISCDGVGIPLYIYHRDPRFASIRTNIVFKDEDSLNSFVMKLAQRCGRSISVADPLLDGALPDGSRVQATFGSGISMKGSNFTIRKFTKDPLTFIDLINYGTIGSEMLAYLWLAIEHGKSILIAGPTATGKTTMLNSLSIFIRPELKIVSIEDTPELRLPHENWIPQVARSGFGPETAAGKKLGEVSLFDLLKASLRQRPDSIIVGEVRGKEAYVLFQQIATGHPGMSTIHAESMQAVINRLRTPPINLPPSLVQHLDVLIIITRQRIKGRYIRRVKRIVEVLGYDLDKDKPLLNTAYEWDPAKDVFKYSGKSKVLRDAMLETGSNPDGILVEVERRMKVIDWMHDNGLRDYKNVGRVVNEYYQNPEAFSNKI